jgi:hypothetical protein
MLVESSTRSSGVALAENNFVVRNWNPVCHITYSRDSWVKLNQPPSDYSQEEALLLCEKSDGVWVSWIPGHGEIVLDKSEFYC